LNLDETVKSKDFNKSHSVQEANGTISHPAVDAAVPEKIEEKSELSEVNPTHESKAFEVLQQSEGSQPEKVQS
jgi:hypothetical protein